MPQNRRGACKNRRGVCIFLVLALLTAAVLAGCSSGEPQPAAAESQASGAVGGLVEQLKEEDGQSELEELADESLTAEEREEAHEAVEQQELAAEQEQEQEPEAESEREGEGRAS